MNLLNNSALSSISVAIFDATGITSDLLRQAFSSNTEFEVVGCPKSIEHAVQVAIEKRPDVIVISTFERSSFLAALDLLKQLSLIHSTTRAVVLSATLTNEETIAYFRAQARGVLSGSSADFAVLCKCIKCVHSGQIWASSEQLVCLIQSLTQTRDFKVVDAKGLPILSAREQEVLHLLAEGLSNRDLAVTLKLSEHTIRNHLFHIFDKLGVSSRMEAVLYAFNHSKNISQVPKAGSKEETRVRRRNEAFAANQ
jgi:DNA-binding NarL/FixJ family response regulator